MKTNQLAVLAVLLGSVAAGAAFGQAEALGRPPDDGARYDTDRRDLDQSPYGTDPYDADGYNDDRYGREPTTDVGFFYNELSPYGEWIRSPQYGWAWFPRHVRAGWRPYSLGRWVESDYGWTWVSYEPFGWATYHYGRWAWDRQIGWLWVPGTVWGPAWVAWQQGGGYIGWAPLPPAVGFEAGLGIRLGGLDLRIAIQPRDYAFVDERSFLALRLTDYIMPPGRNDTLFRNTENFTHYSVEHNRVINRGVAVDRIERVTHRRVERLRTYEVPTRDLAGVRSDQLRIYRPRPRELETVRAGRRNDAGLQPLPSRPSRAENQPVRPDWTEPAKPAARPVSPDWVAPRRRPEPRENTERLDKQEQQKQQAYEKSEQQRLEQIHQQERAQARNQADAQAVAHRHAEELKAQQEERQRSEEQLRTRQQIERQAAQATPERGRQSGKQPPPKREKKNEKHEQKDDKGNQEEDKRPPLS